jgi:integrase
MARTVKDSNLDTRTARGRLKVQHEPYWRALDKGAHLGYRKGKLGGAWLARWRVPGGTYKKKSLGKTDDKADADGVEILNYTQAQDAARVFFAEKAAQLSGKGNSSYTVRQAIDAYLADYETRSGKATNALKYSIEGHIIPEFGETEIANLTDTSIRTWHRKLARTPARLRSKKIEKQKHRPEPETAEEKRQRQVTANKILSMLKAALNFAFSEGKVHDDSPWRKVRPFRNVDAPRIRYLSEKEVKRLVNACAPDFRKIVQAALLTGCRYGELTAMRCADLNSDSGLVHVHTSKSGKARDVTLTDEGRRFFEQTTAGRPDKDLMFSREDGKPWGKSHQKRRLDDACKRAKITPAIGFHILRHCVGSWLAMKDTPLPVIAHQLGHADTRICERHYAHLMPSYVSKTVRENFPTLGIVEYSNVVNMAAKK